LYEQLENIYTNTFADTATGIYLERRVAEQGLTRESATAAIRKGEFTDIKGSPAKLYSGYRFKTIDGDDSLIFTVGEELTAGEYELICETPGECGNAYIGELLPVTNITGLGTATMSDIIIPGEDTENDESLYSRYLARLNEKNFGGNIADYKLWMLSQDGVGAVKIYPIWQGGGTVKCVFLDSSYNVPSAEFIDRIQTAIDPETNHGEGLGLAPIGHTVTIKGADGYSINIDTTLTLEENITLGQLATTIKDTLNDLFLSLKKGWAEQNITVRIAHIEARLLNIMGVVDIAQTTINGQDNNIILEAEAIPILGEVTVNGQTL
ncbi:MAG: baseplate J/gp47 family protein, partial [Muribaculaceae bacterium]|nr:baseplate J/gp47 family protein [Muribaculaceae bacterium]